MLHARSEKRNQQEQGRGPEKRGCSREPVVHPGWKGGAKKDGSDTAWEGGQERPCVPGQE